LGITDLVNRIKTLIYTNLITFTYFNNIYTN